MRIQIVDTSEGGTGMTNRDEEYSCIEVFSNFYYATRILQSHRARHGVSHAIDSQSQKLRLRQRGALNQVGDGRGRLVSRGKVQLQL